MAGVSKLCAPQAAARAVDRPAVMVRAFGAGELVLAAVAVISGSVWGSVLMTVLYVGFAVLTLRLARAGAACGCFGADQSPASPAQSLLSATLAAVAALSAAGGAHTAGWILGRPPGTLAVLIMGTAAVVYGIVLAYTELPQLWRSWSPAA